MADVNVRMRVTADTSDADKKLEGVSGKTEKIKAASEKAQQAAATATGAGGNGSGGSGVPPVDTKAAAREMADEFGKRAGRAIGSVVVSFMMNQGVSTAFSLMRRPGEDNRRLDQAESTITGAITMAGTGATIGGPLGATVGALLGGLNAFVLKEKEIRDSLAKSRIDYDRERGAARISSARNQEEAFFNWSLGMSTPEEKVKRLQERAKELQGAGNAGDKVFDAYNEMVKKMEAVRPQVVSGSGSVWAGGAQVTMGDVAEYEKRSREVMAERSKYLKAMESVLSGNTNNAPELGGNKVGTANWYRALWEFAKNDSEYGLDDERTGKIREQLNAVNSMIDPLKMQELDVYKSQLDMIMGFAGRSAITDSASAKGLGVGAQIGGMANDRMLNVVQEILKVSRTSGKEVVEAIRDMGGVSGIVAGAVR